MTTIEKIVAGLQIFAKYDGDVSAEHDVIYASPNRMKDVQLSEEDKEKLLQLDWSFNSELEAWYTFV